MALPGTGSPSHNTNLACLSNGLSGQTQGRNSNDTHSDRKGLLHFPTLPRLTLLLALCCILTLIARTVQIPEKFQVSPLETSLVKPLPYLPSSSGTSSSRSIGNGSARDVGIRNPTTLPIPNLDVSFDVDSSGQEYLPRDPHYSSRANRGVIVWMPHTVTCRGNFIIYLNESTTPAGPGVDLTTPNKTTPLNKTNRGSGHVDNNSNTPPEISRKPALLIREAFVDFRHVSVREYTTNPQNTHTAFRRVGVLMTAVPHNGTTVIVGLAEQHSAPERWKSQISLPNGLALEGLQSSVDFFVHEHPCAKACKKVVTCRVKEWQLILTIKHANQNASDDLLRESLERAAKNGAGIQIDLPLLLRTKKVETFRLFVALTCVAGLVSQNSLPISEHLPRERRECSQAKGAILLSGGPLFGAHQLDPVAWRNVGHYAARAIFGHMWFETVAIGVHPRWTVSEIIARCDDPLHPEQSVRCMQEHHELNRALLLDIARHVENELVALRVPEQEWSRVILFLSCRLGSDFMGIEHGKPCEESHHAGQKILGHSGYAMFGRYHAWVSSIDIDEFIVDEETGQSNLHQAPTDAAGGISRTNFIRSQSAAERFDGIRKRSGASYIRMPWFDFRVQGNLAWNLTSRVMRGQAIETIGFGDQTGAHFNRTLCYMGAHPGRSLSWGGGKVALHCSEGFGFIVHDPYLLNTKRIPLDLSRPGCATRQHGHPPPSRIYTYHARGLSPRFGKCEYVGQPFQEKTQ